MCYVDGLERKRKGERTTFAKIARYVDSALVCFHDIMNEWQTKSDPFHTLAVRWVSIELVK
jgi:hypothetical protein